MQHEPNVLENLRAELSSIRAWIDRGIVLACAMLASLVSRMISGPLYETLAEHLVRGAAGAPAPASTLPP